MPAAHLAPVETATSPLGLAAWDVVAPGTSPEGWHEAGERVWVRPGPAPHGLCLLVPRGHGRPILGIVEPGRRLRGPWGEPCAAERWEIAGLVVGRSAARRAA
jgi:hypothetical protein